MQKLNFTLYSRDNDSNLVEGTPENLPNAQSFCLTYGKVQIVLWIVGWATSSEIRRNLQEIVTSVKSSAANATAKKPGRESRVIAHNLALTSELTLVSETEGQVVVG